MNKISYLGIPGSFTYQAARMHFSDSDVFSGCRSIKSCLDKVESDHCQYAVIPLENSLTGSVTDSYDFLLGMNLKIAGEIILHIHHYLIGRQKNALNKCYSHPQVISQCRQFFLKNSGIVPLAVSDTGSAARLVSRSKSLKVSSIAGKMAADLYKLKVLSPKLEDNPHNFTRFAVVSRKSGTGNKISLIFSVKNKPGSLFTALSPYRDLDLNLLKIESRPVFGKPWEYLFFLDFDTGGKKDALNQLLKKMKNRVDFLKVLGSYRQGKIYET